MEDRPTHFTPFTTDTELTRKLRVFGTSSFTRLVSVSEFHYIYTQDSFSVREKKNVVKRCFVSITYSSRCYATITFNTVFYIEEGGIEEKYLLFGGASLARFELKIIRAGKRRSAFSTA